MSRVREANLWLGIESPDEPGTNGNVVDFDDLIAGVDQLAQYAHKPSLKLPDFIFIDAQIVEYNR